MDEDNEKFDGMSEEESFAELLEASLVKPVQFSAGQKVEARIVKISTEWIFLDLGGKSEGYLDRKELQDEEGELSVKEGDIVQAYFLSLGDNELRFTTRITGGEAGRYHLEEAWRSGIPVEGLVEKEIKGGFEIRIAGGLIGFCPHSQMGLQHSGTPHDLVGQHLAFRIIQYAEKGRNIILSNRSVLEEERRRLREEQKGLLKEGMKVMGTIASIHNFGAFVKIGSLEGLIPVSEISWDRVEDIHGLLEVGREVEVVATNLDWDKDRLSFSLKRALPDPWNNIEKDFPQGSRHRGAVVRLTNFGAFVSLVPGVDGLLHISKLGSGKRIKHPHEVLAKGQAVEVMIDSVDRDNKRISLSLAGSEDPGDHNEGEDDYSRYLKGNPDSMGTLADLLKARLGEKTKK
ncbi:MAG: 30S ribosomal protein S1 [Syntrophobacteraceae bacterium]